MRLLLVAIATALLLAPAANAGRNMQDPGGGGPVWTNTFVPCGGGQTFWELGGQYVCAVWMPH